MPDAINDLEALANTEELNSDSFTEEMPDAINDLEALANTEELNSDSFTEEMPDAINDLEAFANTEELNSDSFTEEMPDTINNPETEQKIITEEVPQEVNSESDEISILDELNNLDSLSIGEIESVSNEIPEITEEFTENNSSVDESNLHVLYDGETAPKLNTSEFVKPVSNSYNFKPEKKATKLMPLFAIVAAIVVVGAFVFFFMKNKDSIDAETLIQTTPENEILATPETNNSDIMSNSGESVIPNIPKDATDISPSAPAVPASPVAKKETVKSTTQNPAAVASARSNKPLNGSKTITLKKVSWEVPDYLSYSDNIRKYLQTAGKSIKLTLSSDLLLTNEYIYSNTVKVDLKLSKDGTVQSAKITRSSGSEQVDKIVLRTVKETLNVVKPARGEVPTPNYNLAIIIYL